MKRTLCKLGSRQFRSAIPVQRFSDTSGIRKFTLGHREAYTRRDSFSFEDRVYNRRRGNVTFLRTTHLHSNAHTYTHTYFIDRHTQIESITELFRYLLCSRTRYGASAVRARSKVTASPRRSRSVPTWNSPRSTSRTC